MKYATAENKELVLEILAESFKSNKSVEYILKDTSPQRLRALMEYSFDTCLAFGKVVLSDDENGCALISFPDKKKTTFKSVLSDVKFILNGAGIKNVSKILAREKAISANYPKSEIYYLWFIGVDPDQQGRGVGSKLLDEIKEDAKKMQRPIYLETSTVKNIPFYKRFGLNVYKELDFTYKLFLINSNY
jgi:ribosomal protein S18 acetylase RimI-like enzyme